MLISSSARSYSPTIKTLPKQEPSQTEEVDEYRPSSASRFAKDSLEIAGGALLGAVPGVGAFNNYLGLLNFGIGGDTFTASLALAGSASNILGTLALAGGAITGNPTALKAGVGLLAGSALTAGYGTFRDR